MRAHTKDSIRKKAQKEVMLMRRRKNVQNASCVWGMLHAVSNVTILLRVTTSENFRTIYAFIVLLTNTSEGKLVINAYGKLISSILLEYRPLHGYIG